MNDINFCANLVMDANLYDKKISPEAKNALNQAICGYEKFLSTDKIKKMTEGDTICLSKVRYAKGWGVKLDFLCGNKPDKSIYDAGVYNSKQMPVVHFWDLAFQTLQFICNKYDISQRDFNNIIRKLRHKA